VVVGSGIPIVYKCKITEPHKKEAKARNGLERNIIIITIIIRISIFSLIMSSWAAVAKLPEFLYKIVHVSVDILNSSGLMKC
jgi:hypothetical protein